MEQAETLLFSKLLDEIRKEFRSGINVLIEEQTMISFTDLTVWLFNKDCQRAVNEYKRMWDEIPATPLGTKSV